MGSMTRLVVPCGADVKQKIAERAAAEGLSEETWLRRLIEAAVEQAPREKSLRIAGGVSIEPAGPRRAASPSR